MGGLFGIGGFSGMYLGAKTQKFVPQKTIKMIVGLGITSLAMKYILRFF